MCFLMVILKFLISYKCIYLSSYCKYYFDKDNIKYVLYNKYIYNCFIFIKGNKFLNL